MANQESTLTGPLNALAAHLNVAPDASSFEKFSPWFGCGVGLRFGKQEFYVLSDEDATTATEAYVDENLRYFSPSFLAMQLSMDEDAVEKLLRAPSADSKLSGLVEKGPGIEAFTREAIVRQGGRGGFLASNDDKEYAVGGFFIYRLI